MSRTTGPSRHSFAVLIVTPPPAGLIAPLALMHALGKALPRRIDLRGPQVGEARHLVSAGHWVARRCSPVAPAAIDRRSPRADHVRLDVSLAAGQVVLAADMTGRARKQPPKHLDVKRGICLMAYRRAAQTFREFVSTIPFERDMSASQPQGQRSGEGTSGLWNHIRDDDQRKQKEPDRRSDDDSRQQYNREGEQQQSHSPG